MNGLLILFFVVAVVFLGYRRNQHFRQIANAGLPEADQQDFRNRSNRLLGTTIAGFLLNLVMSLLFFPNAFRSISFEGMILLFFLHLFVYFGGIWIQIRQEKRLQPFLGKKP